MMKYIFMFLCAAALCSCGTQGELSLVSPDGTIEVTVGERDGGVFYSVTKDGAAVVNRSALGVVLKENPFAAMEIVGKEKSSLDETWIQPWGEEIEIRDNHNELRVELREKTDAGRTMFVVFRAFDDGVGFRYEFPEQEALGDFVIMDESTEFALAGDHKAWSIPAETLYYEALFEAAPVSSLTRTVSTPLTMQTAEGKYLTIHEADLTDYAAMNLVAKEGTTLKADPTPWSTGERVFMKAGGHTPWRTIIIADSAGELMLSRLMLNLNEPSKIADTSWIEPGRYIGVWWGMHTERYTWHQGPKHGATTENVKRYIDFAAEHGFTGVLVEGWNDGWQNDWTVEGDKFSFTRPYSDFDIAEITRYAAEKEVGLTGHHETGGATKNYESQLDEAMAMYEKYGVHAVKTGYVSPLLDGRERHSSQYGVRHYRKVIETAAAHRIMIDNHEPVMPTGLQRTWPNLMTQEGVRGQEWDAWSTDGGNPPDHTTIIPFTRALAGPIDFTPGTFKFENPVHPQTRVRTTIAKQLALSVVIFSPLQMASDEIENYEGVPAFEFITRCPTSWAETVVPHAAIGEYLTVARRDRNSDDWYLGSITDDQARTMELSLDFLDEGARYRAKIFKDGPGADYLTNPHPVAIEEREVDNKTTLTLELATSGGTAIIFTKI